MSQDLNQVVDALTTSVRDLDASRRVGWAKSYEEQQRAEEAQKLQESMRYQRDELRRVASFLRGYLLELADHVQFPLAGPDLAKYLKGLEFLIEDGSSNRGRGEARKALEDWAGITEEQVKRAALKREKRREQRRANQPYRDAMESLAAQYHFNSVGGLRAYLKRHRESRRGS